MRSATSRGAIDALMPWTGPQFAAKHNKKLRGASASKAASIATAMVERGVPEGEAIATANKHASRHRVNNGSSAKSRTGKTRSYRGP